MFARSLSIGAETMVMWFDPDKPLHDRYQVKHDFLSPEQGLEVETISKVVNAFFRWEFNSCESIVRGGEVFPIDYANASPDVALTSLHYYFPWAITALVRWCAFCVAEGRRMRIDVDTRPWFEIGDRDDLSYEEKLRAYRVLADEHFQADAYASSARGRSAIWTKRPTRGSRAPSSTVSSSTRFARRSRHTSTSSSSRITAACSLPGRATGLSFSALSVRAAVAAPVAARAPCPSAACAVHEVGDPRRRSDGAFAPNRVVASATSASIRPEADLPLVAFAI